MSLDTVLAILSLALAIGGLSPYFFLRGEQNSHKRSVIVGTVVSMLVLLSVVTFAEVRAKDRAVERVAQKIKAHLSDNNPMIMEQLYGLVSYGEVPLVPTALDRLDRRGDVDHVELSLQAPNDPSNVRLARGYIANQLKGTR